MYGRAHAGADQRDTDRPQNEYANTAASLESDKPRSLQLESCLSPVDLEGDVCRDARLMEPLTKSRRDNMNAKLRIVVSTCVVLFLSACGSRPQSLIVGNWEVAGARVGGVDAQSATEAARVIKMSAEFRRDGTAKVTMFGQTLQGTYKLNGENELEWTMNDITTKSKLHVTATDLDLTDDANRTITYKYKRK